MIIFFRKNIIFLSILFILSLSFIFFNFHINTFDLHFDEIHWFYWSDPSLNFSETINRLNNYISAHPPLFALLNKIILNFKNETHVLRYITAFNMMINSVLFYFILKKIFKDNYFSLIGVILFFSNIFIIFYAQRFTNYSLLLFFELLSFFYFFKLIYKKKIKNLIIFFCINFLGITSHLYFLLYLAPITLWMLIDIKKNFYNLVSIACSLIAFGLLCNNFISNAFQVGYSNTNVSFDLINSHFLVYFFGGKYLTYLAYLFITVFVIYILQKKNKTDLVYIFILTVPYLTVYLFNLLIGNAWIDGKHLIFFIPFLIIIFLKVTNYLKSNIKIKYIYMFPILLIFLGQLIALYRNYYPNNFNKDLVRRNVELKKFLVETKDYHKLPFLIEKGSDTWPGFNHNLKYYLERNKDFKKSKIIMIDTENEKIKNLNEFVYIYFRDTENTEAKKRVKLLKTKGLKVFENFKNFQIKGIYFKKYK